MASEDPPKVKRRFQPSVVSIILSIVGMMLPLCVLVGGYPFVKHLPGCTRWSGRRPPLTSSTRPEAAPWPRPSWASITTAP
jgi:hypothetical protein